MENFKNSSIFNWNVFKTIKNAMTFCEHMTETQFKMIELKMYH